MPVKLLESVAVTVMTLLPGCRATPEVDHVDVPVQVPLPPALSDHVTEEMVELPDAVPAMSTVALAVE